MARPSRFTPKEIAVALREVDEGTSAVEICRKLGITQTTFYRWRKQFAPVTTEALAGALHRANLLWRDQPAWRRLQHNGMATDVSWRDRAGSYAALYRDVVASRRGP